MATVSIHIEGHEDGSLDDTPELAVALQHIVDRMKDGTMSIVDNVFPESVVPGYKSPFDDETEPATWIVQYSMY